MAIKVYIPKGKNVLMARHTVSMNNRIVCDTRITLDNNLSPNLVGVWDAKTGEFYKKGMDEKLKPRAAKVNSTIEAYLSEVKSVTKSAKSNGLSIEYIKKIAKSVKDSKFKSFVAKGEKLNRNILKNLVDAYIDEIAGIKNPKTYKSLANNISEDILVDELDKSKMLTIVNELNDKGLSYRTIREIIKLIKKSVSELDELEPDLSPKKDISSFTIPARISNTKYTKSHYIVSLTKEEVEMVRNAKLTGKAEQIRRIFLFQMETGLRSNDILRIVNSPDKSKYIFQADSENIMPYVHLFTSKTGAEVKCSIHQSIADMMMDVRPINYQNYKYHLKSTCQKIGLTRLVEVVTKSGAKKETLPLYSSIGTHTARRTYVSLRYSEGIPIEQIMAISGHKDATTLRLYIGKETKDDMFKKMAAYEKSRFNKK